MMYHFKYSSIQGTSSIGLLSDEIDTYINIYNSLYHFQGIDIGSQKNSFK